MIEFLYHNVQTRRPDKLTFGTVLESPYGRWRLGKVEQRERTIYLFSRPFGCHTTYHDSNVRHARGLIHVRFSRNSGVRFGTYPGGDDLDIEVFTREAPTFRDVSGVFEVAPMQLIKAEALMGGRKRGTYHTDYLLCIGVPALEDTFVAFAFLAMEPDNRAALQNWLDGWRRRPSFSTINYSVHIFSNFQPWLAFVVGSTYGED